MNILLIAYKIEPNKGSEDGTGYHLTKALLQKEKNITLITRSNNIDALKADPDFAGMRMIGVDAPKWLGFFKNKERGIILYYYLWQIAVGFKVRALQKTQQYDVIHQLNFHATWAPHFLFSNKSKILWGPLTHHQPVPKKLWFGPMKGYYLHEKVKNAVKKLFWFFDPFLLWAARRSKTIFYSAQTVRWPYSLFKNKLKQLTYAGSAFPSETDTERPREFGILYVGRFVNLKGSVTALNAVQEFLLQLPDAVRRSVSVTVIGDGPLYTDVTAMGQIIMSATGARVEMLPWQEQQDLRDFYRQAAVLIYPSFEGQGLVVAEALSQGCPVLCFENTGPHDLAGIAAVTVSPRGSASDVVTKLASRLNKLFEEFQSRPQDYERRIEASLVRSRDLQWQNTADKIIEAYYA